MSHIYSESPLRGTSPHEGAVIITSAEREGFRLSRWAELEGEAAGGGETEGSEGLIRLPQACRYDGFGSPQGFAAVPPTRDNILAVVHTLYPPQTQR